MPRLKSLPGTAGPEYTVAPWTCIQDSREQFPWTFRDIRTAGTEATPLIVPVKVAALASGDYSVEGYEDRISVERKGMADAWGTFGGGRERFERELTRLSAMDFAAVIVEGSLESCLRNPPQFENGRQEGSRKFTAKSFFRSVLAWQMDFPAVRWVFADSRWMAERACWFLLDRYWRKQQEREKQEKRR
jgi:DNA excision repair protein ERCC-4